MTWQEFKVAAEQAGMTDTTNVWFVDFQGSAAALAVQSHDRLGMAIVSASPAAPEASAPAPTTTRSRR
jgi:hypothetical protein